ncbi:FlgB family protein [Salipiger sp.]|uniref:FlgB family protein n=1 Tax=Salipiger sp. TaxID=2078585 RepID=UPI003A96E111
MFQNLDVFRTAIAMARHAGEQQAISAQNIANADTPKYRALQMPDFARTLEGGADGMRSTRPQHLGAGAGPEGYRFSERRGAEDPNGNTVELESEMVVAVDAKRAHDRALAIYRSNINILRASLGR